MTIASDPFRLPPPGEPIRRSDGRRLLVTVAAGLVVLVVVVGLVATACGPRTLSTTRIPIGERVTQVATSPQGGAVYVGVTGRMAVVDASDARLAGFVEEAGYGDLAVATDGRRAFRTNGEGLAVFDLSTNLRLDPLRLPAETPYVTRIATTRDPRQLVVLMHARNRTTSTLGVVDTDTDTVRSVGLVEGTQPELAVVPDGTKAYLGGSVAGSLVVVDLRTGASRPVAGIDDGGVRASWNKPVAAPDGRHVYASGLGVVEVDTTTDTVVRRVSEGPATSLAVTLDSRTLLATTSQGQVRVLRLADATATGSAEVDGYPTATAVTPDGRHAFVAVDDGVVVVDLLRARRD